MGDFGLDHASFGAATTAFELLGRLLSDQVELTAQRRAAKGFSGARHVRVVEI